MMVKRKDGIKVRIYLNTIAKLAVLLLE